MSRQILRKKKFCRFTVEGYTEIDYKDADKEKLNDLLVKLLNLKDEI